MKKIYIVGIGMGNPDTLTVHGKKIIENSQGLVGAGRMLAAFGNVGVKVHRAIDPLEIYKWIRENRELDRISVLMSGDVGFFSGAKKLTTLLQSEGYEVCRIPGISSIQYLCAAVHTAWEEAKILSLHHEDHNIPGIVQLNGKVFVLTGGERSPAKICQTLTDEGLGQVNVHIGQRLSYPDEKIVEGKAEDLAGGDYDSLSVMLIQNSDLVVRPWETHGLPDQLFIRGKTPMTKQEVRSVAISKLSVAKNDVIYDIGAGTGSVSVELALQAYHGKVYAVEVDGEALGLLGQNREKFKLSNLEIIPGMAPEAIEALPAPDKVFIGGSKGKVFEIIREVRLKNPSAVIVVDAIALESLSGAIDALNNNGFTNQEIVQISVARSKKVGPYNMMMGQNPVFIIRGERDIEDGIQV